MIEQTLAPSTTSVSNSAKSGPDNHAQIRAAAEEFESVFLAQVLNGLTSSLSGEGAGSGLGNAESDPFAGLLQQEYAKLISRSGGVGVADAVMREMLKMQEVE